MESSPSAERDELAAVLNSATFSRAMNASRLLKHVCEAAWAGRMEDLGEYELAVKALGRPDDFDPKTETIVRVEMHNLRKRLKQFYASEGAAHEIRIVLPPGTYQPGFERHVEAPTFTAAAAQPMPADVSVSGASSEALPEIAAVAERGARRTLWTIGALLAIVSLTLIGIAFFPARRSTVTVVPVDTATPISLTDGGIRMRLGSTVPFTDRLGRVWDTDKYFHGGTALSALKIHLPPGVEPGLFNAGRSGKSFSYDIPLPQSSYELHLFFVERENVAVSGRDLDVFANGKAVLSNFDLLSDAGGIGVPDERVMANLEPAPDGKLHLRFACRTPSCFVQALTLLPEREKQVRPIRLVASRQLFVDPEGKLWMPDMYSQGGSLAVRHTRFNSGEDPGLYASERYGNFSYNVPLAPGIYRLTLYFSEMWFGPGNMTPEPPSERAFDVLANGEALLRDFSPGVEAGGASRPVVKSFPHIHTDPQGKLNVSFVSRNNYACLNAIEIVPE